MYVTKRDGRQEPVRFNKITAHLVKLSHGLNTDHCDPVLVAQKVCAGVFKGVTTTQLDELAAETAAAMTANHPDYALVSSFFTFPTAVSVNLSVLYRWIWLLCDRLWKTILCGDLICMCLWFSWIWLEFCYLVRWWSGVVGCKNCCCKSA